MLLTFLCQSLMFLNELSFLFIVTYLRCYVVCMFFVRRCFLVASGSVMIGRIARLLTPEKRREGEIHASTSTQESPAQR